VLPHLTSNHFWFVHQSSLAIISRDNSMLFNPIASTISKWWMFKLLRKVQLLNRLVDLDEILYYGNYIKGDLDHSKMAVCLSPTNNFLTAW
jgi:hypothetical protein